MINTFSYGERGYVLIFKTIGRLFPNLADELCTSKLGHSLAPVAFISRVLVPEAARLLIQNDDEEALDILIASQPFGAALHPDTDTNDDIE